MKTVFSPYSLKKRLKLNSLAQSPEQSGTLLKITVGSDWGVADLCPKPELGDNDLSAEISTKGSLYLRALELAEQDLQARREKRSLLMDRPIKNNFLITDYKNENLQSPRFLNQTIKIKADHDIESLSRVVNAIQLNVKLRIDFNSGLSIGEFNLFLEKLSVSAKEKIEYIEDPTKIGPEWKTWNKIVPLAFDFQQGQYSSEMADFHIVKPSRQSVIGDMKCKVLTSAMDHPVGVAHGLRIAQVLALRDSGFLTLNIYEAGEFNKYFLQQENLLNFSELARGDYGIGMTDDLEKLRWVNTL